MGHFVRRGLKLGAMLLCVACKGSICLFFHVVATRSRDVDMTLCNSIMTYCLVNLKCRRFPIQCEFRILPFSMARQSRKKRRICQKHDEVSKQRQVYQNNDGFVKNTTSLDNTRCC